ncbi:hypothetical protein [Rhodococcus tukisamuensis]|uniref:Hippurate hydrolase n=1 Tax=Rhodococcus tukisamuensis TaxID=168276 RepID=A0A1G7A4B3_9NOCA|nr:hypothetical protein [Rhodococcus tukisamuensis]SDE08726.1 hippurate hydrolase [Rhodococcus tukisamuensis]
MIPDEAVLKIDTRSFETHVAGRLVEGISRIANAESVASRAPRPPEITELNSFPLTVNDAQRSSRTVAALGAALGADKVFEIGPVSGSEDVGDLATAIEVPLVYWFIGGFEVGGGDCADAQQPLPSNHSPKFAPVIRPTLDTGVAALVAAAVEWLD